MQIHIPSFLLLLLLYGLLMYVYALLLTLVLILDFQSPFLLQLTLDSLVSGYPLTFTACFHWNNSSDMPF